MSNAVAVPPVSVPPVVAPLAGGGPGLPVRRVYCVGQNYVDHAREMGSNPDRQEPFFFMKPTDAIVPSGRQLSFPVATQNLHHEVELVIALGKGGSFIAVDHAEALIFGHAVGLDMTRRDIQAEAKKQGRPWDMAKGFDELAPLGPIVSGLPPRDVAITLTVNGEVRQQGNVNQMIWSVPEIIAYLSRWVNPHDPRDNILAGTFYLRLMYDRFGYPGLFAAYNAGPGRYAEHLEEGRAVPGETRAYLTAVGGAPAGGQAAAVPPPVNAIFFSLRIAMPVAPEGSKDSPALFMPLLSGYAGSEGD